VVGSNSHLTPFRYDQYIPLMRKAAGSFSPLITVDRGSGQPLHRQIYDAFRAAIVGRSLGPSQQIPSTRLLASELAISRIPVLNAYSQLLAEGYFETRVGAGTFVSSSLPGETAAIQKPEPSPRVGSRPRRIARSAARLPSYQRRPWIRGQGAFSVSQPALDAFPLRVWANLVAKHCRNPLRTGLQYGDPMGLKELRAAIAVYLRTSRAVRCEADQIMVVSGSQQALDLAARVLLESGSAVWGEEPGYWLARHVLMAAGCRIVPIRIDDEGLDVSEGIRKCGNARAAFVAPSHQYPLGVTMSATRRFQLLNWARRAGAWIIEDDYDSEYRYDTKPIAALQGLDSSSRVIYIGTFSKVLFPSLRAGYIVIPPDLVDYFLAMRNSMDVGPAHLYQAVLADFIVEGHFSRHIRRMRSLYAERRRELIQCIRGEFGSSLEVVGGEAGMHLCVKLPKGFDDREVSVRAARENLWLWPLSPTFIGRPASSGFILGFGSTRVEEMAAAVRQFRNLFDKRLVQ
jgi:GntR family transcriptional regulator / MocR family aminotransferase